MIWAFMVRLHVLGSPSLFNRLLPVLIFCFLPGPLRREDIRDDVVVLVKSFIFESMSSDEPLSWWESYLILLLFVVL